MRTRSSPAVRQTTALVICALVSFACLRAVAPAVAQSLPQGPQAAAAESGQADALMIAAVRRRAAAVAGSADAAALAAFYVDRAAPLWVTREGLTAKARAAMAEIARADDWGLKASAFALPRGDADTSLSALADAEVKLSLAVLSYARFARGGRVDLATFSRNVDQQLSLREPRAVLEGIAATDAPDQYLQGLHPQHPQFALLRRALLRLRAAQDAQVAPATPESVLLPDGPVLKPGMNHPHVALLRRRLLVEAGGAPPTLYDPPLAAAVIAFQRAHKMAPDGVVGGRLRAALNGGQEKPVPAFGDAEQRLILNMERWRWMPEDLGEFHVWNNVPEFLSRVFKHGVVIHSAKIVAGKPDTQTVVFSADMRYIVFHPEWGVPDSIKLKEILPYLRPSGGDFFGLFGADTSVLQRHNLKVTYNGHPVDASQVNWNSVDVRRYSFIQPAGAGNVLGVVKFRFPNSHDIYMHDTPQRELFEKSTRAFSHGCIRVEHPERLAELLLAEDKGWSAERVHQLLAEGYNNEIALEHTIPVHVTYFTAVAGDDGNVAYFGDVYGLDRRLAAALAGQPLPVETAPVEESLREARRAGKGSKQSSSDFFSGLFGN
jgi:L,D-transpeptidase YcbB